MLRLLAIIAIICICAAGALVYKAKTMTNDLCAPMSNGIQYCDPTPNR